MIVRQPQSIAQHKREPHFGELCAEIAALSTLDDWNAFSEALEPRMTEFPLAWTDVFTDAMEAQKGLILAQSNEF